MPIDEIKIYYDTKTKVMYAKGLYSITVLFNADGTPMLYEREDGKLKTAGKGR